ncbi:ABC transporter substrate-binding protein [Exiguobacterium sp. TRN 1102]|jgi:spermidine/putrescine transport system substrate-binding protein|uniref:ABC transporter substrate-binding protein n=1 Tax=Exiguobacterium sp. TRN 1102 TaxID=3420732 RepID=UPI003D77FD77
MKKLVIMLAVPLIVSFGLLLWIQQLNAAQGFGGDNTLVVYNWGDYIDEDLIGEFEEQSGLKVVYQTFDSNEAMLTKIEQGGTAFDVAVPSDYAISKMREENLLLPIDYDKLENFDNIDPRFLDKSFDPGNKYSVPYFWGTVGIVYNPELVDGEITSWNDLWDMPLENDILLADGTREVMGFGLNSLGYSLNTTNKDELIEAEEKLTTLWPNIKAIVGDEIKMLMANREAAAAVVWSGDASEIMYENEELTYVIPEEGTNLWFDNLVIPSTAQNVDGAHQFIDFMLDAEIAARNTDYVGYSTPNEAALEFLDEEVTSDERFYPSREVTQDLEVYENLGKRMNAYYNELYLRFKMQSK